VKKSAATLRDMTPAERKAATRAGVLVLVASQHVSQVTRDKVGAWLYDKGRQGGKRGRTVATVDAAREAIYRKLYKRPNLKPAAIAKALRRRVDNTFYRHFAGARARLEPMHKSIRKLLARSDAQHATMQWLYDNAADFIGGMSREIFERHVGHVRKN
jgi:hypothetical protein